jgi:KDO2-lipid IV(A) lauroyltransferase
MKAARKQQRWVKRCRFGLEWLLLRALEVVVPWWPRRWVQRFGGWLGRWAYRLSDRMRSVTRQNLAVVFGEDMPVSERDRIGRESLGNAVSTVLTLFWSRRLTRAEFERWTVVNESGRQLLAELCGRGRGVIAVTLHYGDWETLGIALGYLGWPATIVQEARANQALEAIFARRRGVSGNRLVPNRFVGMTLLKELKRGGTVALLIDQNATRRRGGAWLEWFGLPAFCPTAVGELAVRTGAAIVAGHAIPLADGRVQLELGPEIAYRSGDSAMSIHRRCVAHFEALIRARPQLWLWSYKRWALRPEPAPGRYPAYSQYNPKMEAFASAPPV